MSQVNNYKTGSVRKTTTQAPASNEFVESTKDTNYSFRDNSVVPYGKKK